MSGIPDYLDEVERGLHVRGRERRRLLHECRDHLDEASSAVGVEEAVRRFGPADELARSFDLAVADGRTRRATVATAAGVVAVGGSALALVNVADTQPAAVPIWAVLFFTCAQAAAVAVVLALLQLFLLRRRDTEAADLRLLCRRNGLALTLSAITMFAAGAAVPGHGSPVVILGGPALAAAAAAGVLRTHLLVRQLVSSRPAASLLPTAISRPSTVFGLSVLVTAFGAVAAFWWDHTDHGTLATSLTAAGVEALLIMVGLIVLGPARHPRQRTQTS